MGTREAALKNLKKAMTSPNIGKHGKAWKTIEREKAREFYLDKLATQLDELSDIQIAAAKDPQNISERQYALNQLVGKPVEKMEVEQTTTLKVDV